MIAWPTGLFGRSWGRIAASQSPNVASSGTASRRHNSARSATVSALARSSTSNSARMRASASWSGRGVMMDDLRCQKVAGVAEAIEGAKAQVVYLSAYSPDLNPIEPAFAKLRAELRRRSERAVDRLWAALGESLDWFTPSECRSYFRHAGYKAIR